MTGRPAKGVSKRAPSPPREPAGLAARRAAVNIVSDVLAGRRTLDACLEDIQAGAPYAAMAGRDRGFVKALASETLRRHGQIKDALARFMDRRPPRRAGRLEAILSVGACQILFLEVPPHAAVDLAVRLAGEDKDARHYSKLANAVLRRLADAAPSILADQHAARLNTPEWLAERWARAYGTETAHSIAEAHLALPPLDITVKSDPGDWAERLGGTTLLTDTVRLSSAGDVTRLDGYAEGAWWVQDAAAALPARLIGQVAGAHIADLCAAPGGKTLQLAAAGGRVTAVERATARLKRLQGNLERTGLAAELVEADAASWHPATAFDAVLLDAPCSATGTLRRNPDIAWTRREADIAALTELQRRLLDNALSMLRPGALLVYTVCSLEPEEGAEQAERLLAEGRVTRVPIEPAEIGGLAGCITEAGDLRTLPCHDPGAPGGMDGFYACRLRLA